MRPDPEVRDRRPENRTPNNLCHEMTDSLRRRPVERVRARARGVRARIVLAELKPLYLVEAGQLQPVLAERVAS